MTTPEQSQTDNYNTTYNAIYRGFSRFTSYALDKVKSNMSDIVGGGLWVPCAAQLQSI